MTYPAIWGHRGHRVTVDEPITVPHDPDQGDGLKDGHMIKTNQSSSSLGLFSNWSCQGPAPSPLAKRIMNLELPEPWTQPHGWQETWKIKLRRESRQEKESSDDIQVPGSCHPRDKPTLVVWSEGVAICCLPPHRAFCLPAFSHSEPQLSSQETDSNVWWNHLDPECSHAWKHFCPHLFHWVSP